MLTYEKYNNKRLSVRGDKNLYQEFIKSLGGRWNSRMRGGEGWLVSLDKEDELKRKIKNVTQEHKLNNLETNYKSRKSQKKYFRENSDKENSDKENNDNESSDDESCDNDSSDDESNHNEIKDDSNKVKEDNKVVKNAVVEVTNKNEVEIKHKKELIENTIVNNYPSENEDLSSENDYVSSENEEPIKYKKQNYESSDSDEINKKQNYESSDSDVNDEINKKNYYESSDSDVNNDKKYKDNISMDPLIKKFLKQEKISNNERMKIKKIINGLEKEKRRKERDRTERRKDKGKTERRKERERTERRKERERTERRKDRERTERRKDRERTERRKDRERTERRKDKYGTKKLSKNNEEFYNKTINKRKNNDFKNLYTSPVHRMLSDSDESDESSSDDFPSPVNSPSINKRKTQKNRESLHNKVNNLQKRLIDLDFE
jgi:hypothetical protein